MAKQKINPELQKHLEAHVANFEKEMADKGFNIKLSHFSITGEQDILGCPCGTEFIIDPLTNNIIGKRCKRCAGLGAG